MYKVEDRHSFEIWRMLTSKIQQQSQVNYIDGHWCNAYEEEGIIKYRDKMTNQLIAVRHY